MHRNLTTKAVSAAWMFTLLCLVVAAYRASTVSSTWTVSVPPKTWMRSSGACCCRCGLLVVGGGL